VHTDAIRLFVRAAERLNISQAGRELGLAPAVAGARLAKLEKTLKADLLHRSTRRVSLSLEGETFLPYARDILAQERAALAALGLGNDTPSGTLRFTAPSTFAQRYIAPLLPDFLQRYPQMQLDLRFSDARFDLIDGSYDLALRNALPEDANLNGRKLCDDSHVLCAAPAYLRAQGIPTHPDALASHTVIAFRGFSSVDLVSSAGEAFAYQPEKSGSRLVMDDGLSMKRATLAGAGISLNSRWSVHEELASGTLQVVLADFPVDTRSALWLVYPKSNVLSAKVRVMIDFLVGELADPLPWDTSD